MKRNESVIKILSDLVAIDSQSYKGNITIVDFLSRLFEGYSQTTQSWIRESDGVKGKNLIVKIPGKSSEHSLIFVCHMDTVPTSSAWETDPFILEENGGKLYGLGTCDTKGGVAAVIEAVFTLTDKPAYDTYLVFDGDEEEYASGIKKYKKSGLPKNAHFIFIEPTDQEVMIAQRGVLSATIVTHGKSQHASLATVEKNEKESAIYKMARVMDLLMQDGRQAQMERDDLLGTNSQNFGIVQGGTGGNVIPDTCKLVIDRRLLPSRIPEKEVKRIMSLLKESDSSVEITEVDTAPGFFTNSQVPFVQYVLNSVKPFFSKAKLGPFIAWSEAGLFANKGDVIILGPGSLSGQAHVANEYIEAQELFSYVHIYQKIMQEIVL